MIKIILGIAILFASIFFGIKTIRALSKKEKLKLTSLLKYSTMCVFATVVTVAAIVFLF